MVVSSRILVQWQEICGYRLYSIQTQLWKMSMEREPNSENRITKVGEFSQETTRKLGSSKEINRNDKRSHKETVQQKKAESTRIEGKR